MKTRKEVQTEIAKKLEIFVPPQEPCFRKNPGYTVDGYRYNESTSLSKIEEKVGKQCVSILLNQR